MRAPVITDEMIGHGLTSPGDFPILVDPGQLVQIGDAGATSHTLNKNDDCFVTGRLEVDGYAFFDYITYFNALLSVNFGAGCKSNYEARYETIIVAIGNSTGASILNLAPADSVIEAVACIVTTAPGGGPSHFDVGRTASGNLDQYIDNQAVALGGRFNNLAQGDGTIVGPHYIGAPDTLTVTTTDGAGTPVNVAGADFKVKVMVIHRAITNPTS